MMNWKLFLLVNLASYFGVSNAVLNSMLAVPAVRHACFGICFVSCLDVLVIYYLLLTFFVML